MTEDEARRLLSRARIGRLATVGRSGQPHVVPVVFAVSADTVYSAVDAKPKRTTALARLDNLVADPRATLLVDHYEDHDWSRLWWVRAEGTGRVVDPEEPEARRAVVRLVARYPQYRRVPPTGPVVALDVTRWSGWAADEGPDPFSRP